MKSLKPSCTCALKLTPFFSPGSTFPFPVLGPNTFHPFKMQLRCPSSRVMFLGLLVQLTLKLLSLLCTSGFRSYLTINIFIMSDFIFRQFQFLEGISMFHCTFYSPYILFATTYKHMLPITSIAHDTSHTCTFHAADCVFNFLIF